MSPSPTQLKAWLEEAGYEHLAVVSWAHVHNSHMQSWAHATKDGLEYALNSAVSGSTVFLDQTVIRAGDDWRRQLASAICRSVSMVAVCAPPYFTADHPWCGAEWLAMSELSAHRGVDTDGSIIPLLFRRFAPFHPPSGFDAIHYEDIARGVVNPNFKRARWWRELMDVVAQRVLDRAMLLYEHDVRPDCTGFTLPNRSAFEHYTLPAPTAPFRPIAPGARP